MKLSHLYKITLLCSLAFLSSCGGSEDNHSNSGGPNVGNLDPAAISQMQQSLMKDEEILKSFSEESRKKIEDYKKSGKAQKDAEKIFANIIGDEDTKKLDTLYGPVYLASPLKQKNPDTQNEDGKDLGFNPGQFDKDNVWRTMAGGAPTCDPTAMGSEFICLHSPARESVTQTHGGVDLAGRINVCASAFRGPSEPVINITLARQMPTVETVSRQVFTWAQLNSSEPDCSGGRSAIRDFRLSLALPSPGVYNIIVQSFTYNADGSLRAVPLTRQVIYQGVPNGSLLNVTPTEPGNYQVSYDRRLNPLFESTSAAATVGSPPVVKLKAINIGLHLDSFGNQNVAAVVENLDESRRVRYSSNIIFFSNGTVDSQLGSTVVVLPGYNLFRITFKNFALNLSSTPIEFALRNIDPSVIIKLLDNSLRNNQIIQESDPLLDASQTLPLRFCFVNSPTVTAMGDPATAPCITTWTGTYPRVYFNGYSVAQSSISQSNGIFSLRVKPQIGSNVFAIRAYSGPITSGLNTVTNGELVGAFAFGRSKAFVNAGRLVESRDPIAGNFIQNAMSLELKASVFNDLRAAAHHYLNTTEGKEAIRDMLKSDSNATPVDCSGPRDVPDGEPDLNRSVEFIDRTDIPGAPRFSIESVNFERFEPNEGRIDATLVINRMHGVANIRTVPSSYYAPVNVTIGRLTIAISISFVPNEQGVQQLVITPQPGRTQDQSVTIVGDDGAGAYLQGITNRAYWPGGVYNPVTDALVRNELTLQSKFRTGILGALFCSIPQQMNMRGGKLNNWYNDLPRLVESQLVTDVRPYNSATDTGYDPKNPLRQSFSFNLFGKKLGFDLAIDALRANIYITPRGLRLNNVPIRLGPSGVAFNSADPLPRANPISQMQQLFSSYAGSVGSFVYPTSSRSDGLRLLEDSAEPRQRMSVQLSEEMINQALFAASVTGAMDLKIDPNFYSTPPADNPMAAPTLTIKEAGPSVTAMLSPKAQRALNLSEVNWNAVGWDVIATTPNELQLGEHPVELSLKTDKLLPPTINFLNTREKEELVANANRVLRENYQGPAGTSPQTLNPNQQYFRLVIPNLEISFYQVRAVEDSEGGILRQCFPRNPISDRYPRPRVSPILLGDTTSTWNQACGQSDGSGTQVFVDSCSDVEMSRSIRSGEMLFIKDPFKNGPRASALPMRSPTEPAPMIKLRTSLVLHGAIQGVYHEVLTSSRGTTPQTFVRLRIFPRNPLVDDLRLANNLLQVSNLFNIQVVENNVGMLPEDLLARFETLLDQALLTPCENFNEIQIPLNGFKLNPAQAAQLGIASFDLVDLNGDTPILPQTNVSGENASYLELISPFNLDRCLEPLRLGSGMSSEGSCLSNR